jgi:hypothetical protein
VTSKLFSLLFVGAVGIIVADVLIHPKGTNVVLTGLGNLTKTAGNQMLGYKAK